MPASLKDIEGLLHLFDMMVGLDICPQVRNMLVIHSFHSLIPPKAVPISRVDDFRNNRSLKERVHDRICHLPCNGEVKFEFVSVVITAQFPEI